MNDLPDNPWAARFTELLDVTEIKHRATLTVPPLTGLNSLDIETAVNQLDTALKAVFFPSSQCLSILCRWVGMAYAHCLTAYEDERKFIAGVYGVDAPLPSISTPMCLTGWAGTGKSELIKAFRRILSDDFRSIVSADHSEFIFKAMWTIRVNARISCNEMLMTLSGINDASKDLIRACRKRGYRDGVAIVFADEFQFATQSASANAVVTRMLLSLAYLGLPCVFAANFSLLNRLLKRPHEDQDRLLADPVVLLPEAANSADWKGLVMAQKAVAPDVFIFNEDDDADALHRYSAAIKRDEVRLLLIAYRIGRSREGKVTRKEIDLAYRSPDFAFYRKNIEIIARQIIENRRQKGHDDLWCPIELPKTVQTEFTEQVQKGRSARVADAKLRSSLTAEEKKILNSIETPRKHQSTQGAVFDLKRKKPLTADELKANANWYRDSL